MFVKTVKFFSARKTLAVVLSAATVMLALVAFLPFGAHADGTVYYLNSAGNPVECTEYTILSADSNSWDGNNGWYVVDRDLQFSERLFFSNSVNLILMDDCRLSVQSGIQVNTGALKIFAGNSTDMISGTGMLAVKGKTDPGNATAGIEGPAVTVSGNAASFYVYGGTVCAEGGPGCAGIRSRCLLIRTFGGSIDAKGGTGAAGIGGNEGEMGTVSFFGGTVYAYGSGGGAGIGGGKGGECTDITFEDTTVYAFGDSGGAGIGGGENGKGEKIRIKYDKNTVTAIGGTGAAGIGGGKGGQGYSIAVLGGTVTAEGGEGAGGIGSGAGGDQAVSVGITENYLYKVYQGESAADTAVPPDQRGDLLNGTKRFLSITPVILPESITVLNDPKTFRIGDTEDMFASALPAQADQDVTWTSEDENIAYMNGNKLVCCGIGKTTVKAVSVYTNDVYGTYEVTVKGKDISKYPVSAADADYTGQPYSGYVEVTGLDGALPDTEYSLIYMSEDGTTLESLPVSAGNYYVKAVAVEGGFYDGETEKAAFRISPLSVTVTAQNASKTYGDKDPEFEAKVTGLIGEDSIEYSLSRPEGEDAGYYNITASGEASQGNYAVTYEGAKFEITKKNVTVTPDDKTMHVGAVVPKLTYSASGLKDGDTLSGVTLSVEGDTKVPGECAITAEWNPDADKNYKAEITGNGKLTVTDHTWLYTTDGNSITAHCTEFGCPYHTGDTLQVVLTVPENAVYDGSAHKAAYTDTLTGKTGASVSAITYSNADGDVKDAVNAGKYTVSISVGGATASVEFSIAQAKATVTAQNASKTYGEKDPEFNAAVAGLVGEDRVEYRLSRQEGENAGSYDITASGEASQGNYAVTYEGAEFEITKKDVTVIPDNKQSHTGKAVPELTYTADGLVGDDVLNGVTLTCDCDINKEGKYDITAAWDSEEDPNYNVIVGGNGTLVITGHVWLYAADGNVIYAYCGDEDCQYHGGSDYRIVITVPENAVYNGTPHMASYTDTVSDNTGAEVKEIEYVMAGRNVKEAVNAGKYTASISVGGVTASAEFTIAQAEATVTAQNASKTYGEKDPEFNATVAGLVGEDKVEYRLSRQEGENVGSYDITASGEISQGNYTVTFNGAKFSIGKKDVTITPENKGTHIGRSAPELTYTADGLVGGDVLNGITLSTDGDTGKDGEYSIVATWDSSKDPNYNVIISGNATLRVTGHRWAYTASGNVITAHCEEEGCAYHSGDGLKIVLTAPEDAVYNGTPYVAAYTNTITDITGDLPSAVTYSDPKGAVNAGRYTAYISIGGAKASAEFTVEQAAVTVTAQNASKMFKENDPELKAEVKGLVGSDTVDYSLSRQSGENAGGYDITVSGEQSQGNYRVQFVSAAKLTIEPLDIKNAKISLEGKAFEYDGKEKIQEISSVILDGTELEKGKDYVIEGKTDQASDEGVYELVIKGKGNYTGTASKKWAVLGKKLPDGIDLKINSSKDVKFNGSEKDIASSVLSAEDISELLSGEKMTIELKSKDVTDSISEKEKKMIQDVKPDATFGYYVDIGIEVTKEFGTPVKITETNKPLELTIDLPDSLKPNVRKREYDVVRVHEYANGTSEAEKSDITYDKENHKVLLSNEKFSIFAVGYIDIPEEVPGNTDSGDTGSVTVYAVMGIIAMICAGAIVCRKRRSF